MTESDQTGAADLIQKHYETEWGRAASNERRWSSKFEWQLPSVFRVLEFCPDAKRHMWTYATCGMSCQGDAAPVELHLFSPVQCEDHFELLTAIAHYHLTGSYLGVGHIVNFGRPWLPGSRCEFGFVSLPYLDGPKLEWMETPHRKTQFLWLIPITEGERDYALANGIEALEMAFEKPGFNYLDPSRQSAI